MEKGIKRSVYIRGDALKWLEKKMSAIEEQSLSGMIDKVIRKQMKKEKQQ